MITKFGVKDLNTGEFWCSSGRGDRYHVIHGGGFGLDPDNMTLYNSTGPANCVINAYNKAMQKPNSFNGNAIPTFRQLILTTIVVSYAEM
jgi:hypothetical protein